MRKMLLKRTREKCKNTRSIRNRGGSGIWRTRQIPIERVNEISSMYLDETSFHPERSACTTTSHARVIQRKKPQKLSHTKSPEEQNDENPKKEKNGKREREREREKSSTNLRGLTFVVAFRGTFPSGIVDKERAPRSPTPHCRNYPSRMNNPSSTSLQRPTTAGLLSVGSNQKDPTLGRGLQRPSEAWLSLTRFVGVSLAASSPLSPINLVVLDFAVLRGGRGGEGGGGEAVFSHGRE